MTLLSDDLKFRLLKLVCVFFNAGPFIFFRTPLPSAHFLLLTLDTAIILCFTVQAATLSFQYSWLVLGPPANHTGSPQDEAHIHKRYTPGRNTSHLIASEKLAHSSKHKAVNNKRYQAKTVNNKHISIFPFVSLIYT